MSGNTAEALIATAHAAMDPVVGVHPTTTWLGRATIQTVEEVVLSPNKDRIPSISNTSHTQMSHSITNDKQHHHHHDELSSAVKIASAVSGYPPKVCQDILTQFNEIKKKNEENLSSSTTSPKHSKQ